MPRLLGLQSNRVWRTVEPQHRQLQHVRWTHLIDLIVNFNGTDYLQRRSRSSKIGCLCDRLETWCTDHFVSRLVERPTQSAEALHLSSYVRSDDDGIYTFVVRLFWEVSHRNSCSVVYFFKISHVTIDPHAVRSIADQLTTLLWCKPHGR